MVSAKNIIEKLKTSNILKKLQAGRAVEMLKSSGALEKLKTFRSLKSLKTSNISPGWFAPLKAFGNKIALGIDISDKQINLALLKKCRNGHELLKYAAAPVPDGAIENGNIENPTALANAIQSLKNSKKIRTTQAAVSLFTKPLIVQIMGVPKQIPSNIGQFIQDQIKNFAVLPSNQIAFDFCGVAGARAETNIASRLLVAAADDRKIADIVKVCNQAGLAVESIEPSVLAYTRALYASKVAGKFDRNVLLAVLQDNTLNLCVFRKQMMDFVRVKNVDQEKTAPDELCQWLAEQINMIIQFYDVETTDSCGKWETVLVVDYAQLPENAEDSLRARVVSTDLQLLTNEDVSQTAVIAKPGKLADSQLTDDKPSPVAIGLAMKLLGANTHNLGVNLLPQEVVRLRTTQRGVLVTANIIAATFLFMVLATQLPNQQIKKINESLSGKKTHLLKDTHDLVTKRASLNKKIKVANSKLDQIDGILGSYNDTDWFGLLNDIGKRIPKTARITSLSGVNNSTMSLKGQALSNEAVYVFADMLNKSEYINSAAIAGTNRDTKGLIKYEIRCALAPEKGNSNVN